MSQYKYSEAIQVLWQLKQQGRNVWRSLRLLVLTQDLTKLKNPSEKHLLYLKKWLSKLKKVKKELAEQRKEMIKNGRMCRLITDLAIKLKTPILDLEEETVLSYIDILKENEVNEKNLTHS